MKRFEELKSLLTNRRYFKIVCGAGNEDAEEVRKLSLVYTLAGATGIDVSANVEIVQSSVQGVNKAFELAEKFGVTIGTKPFINVSIGMRGDPHIRKARIDPSRCTHCGACKAICIQRALSDEPAVIEKRCIGCGECARTCQAGAIVFFDKRKELGTILPACLNAGAETFELHAIIPDDASVMADWELMNSVLADNYISMCLDRSQMSDAHLLRRIRSAKALTGDRLMIQADGVPMSGGEDDFNTTLQAIAISDMVRKGGIDVMILASGGTNSKTGELARLCAVDVNGVSIGTFARKIVSDYIDAERFDTDLELIRGAVRIAQELVWKNLEAIGARD